MNYPEFYKNGVPKVLNPDNIIYEYSEIKEDLIKSDAMDEFLEEREVFTDSSKAIYVNTVSAFCYFYQKKIDDLIDEYKEDQKDRYKDDKDFKVRKDIKRFARHCVDNNQAKNTIAHKYKKVKTFLKDNDVYIPNFKVDLSRYDDSEGYYTKKDLPDRKSLQTAINGTSSSTERALFAWIYTTGSGRTETANLTVKSFIDGISEFCKSENPKNMIEELDGHVEEKKVIPIIKMFRKKTSLPYYTVTTPETVQFIIDHIEEHNSFLDDLDQPLFGLTVDAISNIFLKTNFKYDWGKRGRYNFFGCHRLRHNHYTQINDQNLANRLEGRTAKNLIDKTYDHNDDPEEMREAYKEHMYKFQIFTRYDVMLNSDAYRQLQEQLEEERIKHEQETENLKNEYEEKIRKLEEDNNNLNNQVNSIENRLDQYARSKDIEKIHQYASKNQMVNENHLIKLVMQIYNEDIEKDKNLFVDESYIDSIIHRAYNRQRNEEAKWMDGPSRDRDFSAHHSPQINNLLIVLKDIIIKYSRPRRFSISDYQKEKIDRVLWEYALELTQKNIDKESIDKDEVIELVKPILM